MLFWESINRIKGSCSFMTFQEISWYLVRCKLFMRFWTVVTRCLGVCLGLLTCITMMMAHRSQNQPHVTSFCGHTVDGGNPAAPGMVETLETMGYTDQPPINWWFGFLPSTVWLHLLPESILQLSQDLWGHGSAGREGFGETGKPMHSWDTKMR